MNIHVSSNAHALHRAGTRVRPHRAGCGLKRAKDEFRMTTPRTSHSTDSVIPVLPKHYSNAATAAAMAAVVLDYEKEIETKRPTDQYGTVEGAKWRPKAKGQ